MSTCDALSPLELQVQTRSLRTCTGLLSILTLAARGLSSFGEDHNTRSGRLIVSKGLSSSNFNSEVKFQLAQILLITEPVPLFLQLADHLGLRALFFFFLFFSFTVLTIE